MVTLGCVVQTITGFAMGLVVMAGVALLSIADISFTAAVVSFISFLNASIALRQGYRQVDWEFVKWITVGLTPALIGGYFILDYLSEYYYEGLRMLLGVVVVLAGTMLMISPEPFKQRSGPAATGIVGIAGGLIAGLYSAGGAPLAYFMYRQPVSINTIRFSLLVLFVISTGFRAIVVGVAGELTTEIMYTTLLAIPVVVIATLITARIVPVIPDKAVRMLVFVVLTGAGLFLIFSSAFSSAFSSSF